MRGTSRKQASGNVGKVYTRKDYRNHQVARWGVEGVQQSFTGDFVWSCVTSPWWSLLVLVVISYVLLAVAFATLLVVAEVLTSSSALQGSIPKDMSSFECYFWFAMVNLVTTGLGEMAPANRLGYAGASVMHLVGILMSALLVGFFVTQANTPQARILFSKVGVMRYVDGKQQLVLRGGNVRGVFLAMPDVRLSYVREIIIQGSTSFVEECLPLQPRVALHPGFEIVYTVTEDSAISGKTKEDMIAEKGFFGVVVNGTDEYTCQIVQSSEAIFAHNIYWNAKFEEFKDAPKSKTDNFGILRTLNFRKLDWVVVLPPENWPKHLPPLPEDQHHRIPDGELDQSVTGQAYGFSTFDGSHRVTLATEDQPQTTIKSLFGVAEASTSKLRNDRESCCSESRSPSFSRRKAPSKGGRMGSLTQTLHNMLGGCGSRRGPGKSPLPGVSRQGSLGDYSSLADQNWSIEAAGYGAGEMCDAAPPQLAEDLAEKHLSGGMNPGQSVSGDSQLPGRFSTAGKHSESKGSHPPVKLTRLSSKEYSRATRELLRNTDPRPTSGGVDVEYGQSLMEAPQDALISYKSEPLDDRSPTVLNSKPAFSAIDLSRIGVVHARSSKSLARDGLLQGPEANKAAAVHSKQMVKTSKMGEAPHSNLQDRWSSLLRQRFRQRNTS